MVQLDLKKLSVNKSHPKLTKTFLINGILWSITGIIYVYTHHIKEAWVLVGIGVIQLYFWGVEYYFTEKKPRKKPKHSNAWDITR